MTEQLYRKEAIEARKTSLYGRVILKSPPSTLWVSILILTLLFILIFGSTALSVNNLPLWEWLLKTRQD